MKLQKTFRPAGVAFVLMAASLTLAAAAEKVQAKGAQSADPAAVEVLHWKDGRAAALMLMFDDNLESQRRNAVPELEKRRIQATFYLNPGKNGFAKNLFWQVELPKLGHEYAAHTMTHKVAEESKADAEISESATILRKLHPPTATSPLMSFARPGGKGAFEVSRAVEAELLKKHQLISRDSGGLLMYVGEPPDKLEQWLDTIIKKKGEGKICFHGVGGDYPLMSFSSKYENGHAGRIGHWKLVLAGPNPPKLYDLTTDPDEHADRDGRADSAIAARLLLDPMWILRQWNADWRRSAWGNASNVSPAFATALGE